jgi:protein gp37
MAETSSIEWTDATWNPITGCSVLTSGCARCYAMTLAGGRMQNHPSRRGLTVMTSAGPVWTGEVRFNEPWLCEPLGWGKPRRIFVCAHGDLFHENVPDAWIDRVFAVMALRPDHSFQVLTKRAARMRAYITDPDTPRRIFAALAGVAPASADTAWRHWVTGMRLQMAAERIAAWPLANVWLGVSAEDQETANFRVAELLKTPAAVRYVSAEPLLGGIDFTRIATLVYKGCELVDALAGVGKDFLGVETVRGLPRIDQVIVGGESGPRARPSPHPAWVLAIRDACVGAGVAFFFKQWGDWKPCEADDGEWPIDANTCGRLQLDGRLGPDGWPMQRVGKKFAGRQLAGLEWNEQPRAPEALAA